MKMQLLRVTAIISLLITCNQAFAQKDVVPKEANSKTKTDSGDKTDDNMKAEAETDKRLPIDVSKRLEVKYGSSPWNRDSTRIDNAELFVRDASSGKVLKILLEETEPDSSTFSGSFSVGFSKDGEFAPEIYISPDRNRMNLNRERIFIEKIRKQQVGRKPIVFKTGKDGQQLLDVYDTKDQAKSAYSAYLDKMKKEQVKESLVKPIAKKADEAAAALAAHQAKLAELAALAASREEERVRKEQLERQRAEERIRQQNLLKQKEREQRVAKAKAIAEEALIKYKEGDFIKAEELFKESIFLDPNNTNYYFSYGVTLYRNEKFDDALVTLNMANVDETTAIEKNYYMGLVHYRLTELDQAAAKFKSVKESKHQIMSPSAAFYLGVIRFSQEKFEEAKEPFEFVLDTSTDPRLDEKAEEYLEKLANALIFKKKQERRHDGTFSLGAMYDSNVLFSPDNQTASATTEVGGMRFITTAGYDYRVIYERDLDWIIETDLAYYYSSEEAHKVADPMLASLKSPFAWKGVWGKRGFKLGFTPGYETLFMDPDNTGTRVNILNSLLFDTDLTLIMQEDWFASYTLALRSDDSLTADSVGDSDADALQPTLRTDQTFFLDKSKKRAFIAGAGYTLNNAIGDEKIYSKLNLSFTYSQPYEMWKDASWNANFSAYKMNYPKATESRSDTNYTLNYSLSKVQNPWFSWATTLSYSVNNSNTEANQYSKYSAMLTMIFDIDEWYYKE